MKLAFLPDIASVEATVQTEAPGMVAEQVEQRVTRPVESALAGSTGVAHIHSQSSEGLSVVTLTFAQGADPVRVREGLLEHLAGLDSALPNGVGPPHLWPVRAPGGPLLQIGFQSDQLDPMTLRDLVQWTVKPKLVAVPGVADVTVLGGQVRRIEVRARPADLSDSDLGFLDILGAVRRATGLAGAGFIDTPIQRIVIEPRGQATTMDAVGAGQIQTAGAAPVRIADVADVVEAPAPGVGDALIDGRPAVLVQVNGQVGSNTLELTKAVEQALAQLRPILEAQHVKVRSDLSRPASFIASTVRAVALDLMIAIALVALVLFFALRDLRAALVSLVSIPLSFLLALLALKTLGLTLNAMTIGGLAVGLGVVIDDAVIDVEAIVARLRDAERRHASRAGAILAASLEVRAPVIYASLAVVAAAMPLLLLPGLQGALLRPMAIALVAATLASLAVAALVTPALALGALGHLGPEPERPPGRAQAVYLSWLRRLGGMPQGLLILACVMVALAVVGGSLLARPQLLPEIHDDSLSVSFSMPAATSLQAMREGAITMAKALKSIEVVQSVVQRIGRDPTGEGAAAPETSAIDIGLKPGLSIAAQDAAAEQIFRQLSGYPGVRPQVRTRMNASFNGGAPSPRFSASIFGHDLDAIDKAARQVVAALHSVPGGQAAHLDDASKAPVVRVDLNFNRLAIYGLSVADVLDTVQAAFAGERVAQIYEGDRAIDLAISAQDSLRRDPEAVGDLLLRSTSGFAVPLRSVANVYLTDGRSIILHDDGMRRQVVTADPGSADPTRFAKAAKAAIADQVRLPEGVFLGYASAEEAAGAARFNLALSWGLATLAILALLTVAFDGRLAAVSLVSTLFFFLGAEIAILALGGALSVGVLAGLIALFGLAIRSAILLVSRLDELVLARRQSWSFATVLKASGERFTPLLTSSGLVAVALAPFAIQAGYGGFEIVGPMAIVVIAGLVTGTIASLVFTPLLAFRLWRPSA